MNDHAVQLIVLALIMSLLSVFSDPARAESPVTILGVISDDGQLFADDGTIYEIADTETGIQLMEMTGRQVKATGHVMKSEETEILVVLEFEVVRK